MNKIITLPRLADYLAEATGHDRALCEKFMLGLTTLVGDALAAGESVHIKAIGTFRPGAPNSKKAVEFLPDADFAEAINQPFAMFEAVELDDSVTQEMLEAETKEEAAKEKPEENAGPKPPTFDPARLGLPAKGMPTVVVEEKDETQTVVEDEHINITSFGLPGGDTAPEQPVAPVQEPEPEHPVATPEEAPAYQEAPVYQEPPATEYAETGYEEEYYDEEEEKPRRKTWIVVVIVAIAMLAGGLLAGYLFHDTIAAALGKTDTQKDVPGVIELGDAHEVSDADSIG